MQIFLWFLVIIVCGVVFLWLLQKALGKLPRFGIVSRTLRGEKVQSRAEKKVADFFYLNAIEYQYEKSIKLWKKKYRPDFYLPEYDIYIEYWWLIGNPEYDAYKKAKSQQYAKHWLRWFGLQYKDLKHLHQVVWKNIEKVHGGRVPRVPLWKRLVRFLRAVVKFS